MTKNFLTLEDVTNQEFQSLLDLSAKLKQNKGEHRSALKDKTVALLFQKPSNRTRVSFEVGTIELGGYCLYLSPGEIDLGKRETTADVAKTLSRYLDCIVARTNTHDDIVELGENAIVPIINGLSDLYHPCQGLADVFSIKEKFGTTEGLTVAFVGDGNNVCHSLLLGCAKVGMNVNVATPKGFEPLDNVVNIANKIGHETGAHITLTESPQAAVKDAHVIYSDVWISMGQEEETKKRLKKFKDYQIDDKLVSLADNDYIFMHCLPAHRGYEVTEEVIDGPHSIIFDQAENRMHVQKAVLLSLLG